MDQGPNRPTSHSERVAARTVRGRETGSGADSWNRTRYRGQPRRGRMSAATTDAFDVRAALGELVGALAVLDHCDAILDPTTRRAEHRMANGKIALASRFLDDILDRRDGRLR